MLVHDPGSTTNVSSCCWIWDFLLFRSLFLLLLACAAATSYEPSSFFYSNSPSQMSEKNSSEYDWMLKATEGMAADHAGISALVASRSATLQPLLLRRIGCLPEDYPFGPNQRSLWFRSFVKTQAGHKQIVA
jgi:hypothetical protein